MYLDDNNITQQEISILINKSLSAVNQNLNGMKGDFTAGEIKTICQKYSISADEYFFYT